MERLLQALYTGILNGSIYGLMALGLTLVWGSLRMLNLAHGALYLAGGYVAWTLTDPLGLPLVVAFPLTLAATALLGLALQAVVIHPMLGRPGWDTATLVSTVGVSIALESAALLIFEADVRHVPEIVRGYVNVRTVTLSLHELVVIAVTVAALVLLGAFLKRSRHGLAIRAVSQEMDAARLLGVPVRRSFLIVMSLSAALAALAGILLSPIRFLRPDAGYLPMTYALVVTIFGGLGSVKGTVWAAYLIGLLDSFLQVYLRNAWASPVVFAFMIVMLVIRPNGLFGLGEARRL